MGGARSLRPSRVLSGELEAELREGRAQAELGHEGNPSKMAPDFPRNKYRTPCRANASRISSACWYSNAAIAQPGWQVFFAPAAIVGHAIERPIGGVVHHRLVSLDERIFHPLLKGPALRSLELSFPLPALGFCRLAAHKLPLFACTFAACRSLLLYKAYSALPSDFGFWAISAAW